MLSIPADYPTDPRATARAVLKAIGARPELFDMNHWAALETGARLTPPLPGEEATACGTVMCAAGWTAHLTGWTLFSRKWIFYATKEISGLKVNLPVADAAAHELGLRDDETFWYADHEKALGRLRRLAGTDND